MAVANAEIQHRAADEQYWRGLLSSKVKDADITGQPITGVRYNDRQYTFYPYAGRMVSPKGGLLGYIKTAKGKLHGRFYTRGQWFLFEPAPEGNEPFLAHYTVGEDVTAKMVVNKLLESEML